MTTQRKRDRDKRSMTPEHYAAHVKKRDEARSKKNKMYAKRRKKTPEFRELCRNEYGLRDLAMMTRR